MTTPEQDRRVRAASLLGESKLDALYITSLSNIRYLTGFNGSNAALLLLRDGRATLFTDPRYTVQSKQQANCRIVIAKGPLAKSVLGEIKRTGVRKIGFEADYLTVSDLKSLQKDLPGRVWIEPAAGLIERLRMVKDAGEIEKIRASVNVNSRALDAAMKRFKKGMTESELAAEIDYRNRKLGAEAPAFGTIVAAGARAALPHAHPGPVPIGTGMILIDMGAFCDGYASDMTRMFYVGSADAKYKRVYGAVLEAQRAAIDAIKPGIPASAVDRAARGTLKKHGLDREFVHSTGHGLGLEIHEQPRIGRKQKTNETKLETGMAITVEPGVYIEGWGGIRIEDTVIVTAAGCDILTPSSKELIEIR